MQWLGRKNEGHGCRLTSSDSVSLIIRSTWEYVYASSLPTQAYGPTAVSEVATPESYVMTAS
jgi:hypothetical protein